MVWLVNGYCSRSDEGIYNDNWYIYTGKHRVSSQSNGVMSPHPPPVPSSTHTHTCTLTEMAEWRLPEFSVQVMGVCVGLAWHAGMQGGMHEGALHARLSFFTPLWEMLTSIDVEIPPAPVLSPLLLLPTHKPVSSQLFQTKIGHKKGVSFGLFQTKIGHKRGVSFELFQTKIGHKRGVSFELFQTKLGHKRGVSFELFQTKIGHKRGVSFGLFQTKIGHKRGVSFELSQTEVILVNVKFEALFFMALVDSEKYSGSFFNLNSWTFI